MNRNAWSDDDRVEYDQLCDEAWRSSDRTGDRVTYYIRLLSVAEQAQRFYAMDCMDEALRIGAAAHLKSWRARQQRGRIPVSYEGKVISARRVIGTTVIDGDGNPVHSQALIDFFTWEQLEAKAQEYATNIRAYRVDLDIILRVLELRDLCPGAANPDDATRQLGITLEDFLLGDAAA